MYNYTTCHEANDNSTRMDKSGFYTLDNNLKQSLHRNSSLYVSAEVRFRIIRIIYWSPSKSTHDF